MENSGRMDKVNELLRTALADLLRARFGAAAVAITITRVECSPDLRNARVGYSVMTDDLNSARKFWKENGWKISKLLAVEVVLKRHPKLSFVHDDSLRNLAAVEKILGDLEQSGELEAPKKVVKKKKSAPRK